jgi:phosphoribosylformylglycinamidine cyclo-ligase
LERTKTLGSIGAIGGFGGLFDPDLSGMKRPIAVSGTDGVGTKLKIAFLLDKHDTIGIDCVAMCVNDIICAGAQPYFFVDYIAMGKNKPERTERIVAGIADGCVQAGCALVGGETAEHPGMMPEDEYDLAGFAVGFVEYDDIIDGSDIVPGDVVIGLASSGLHSNGFSLVRKILGEELSDLGRHVPELGRTLGEELLQPTKIYVKPIMGAIARFGKGIKGIAHITGGGFFENIPRMLPQGIRAVIDTGKIPTPPIFDLLAKKGGIPERDMYNTFNMGVGLALCVSMDDVDAVVSFLRGGGETPLIIGRCIGGDKGVELTW